MVFDIIVQKLAELKFFDFFFPFVLTLVLLYALLRRTKLFGEMREGQILSAVVAIIVAFLVFGYPVLVGLTFGQQLSAFFTQLVIVGLLFIMALVFASMFYPDFPKMLSEKFMTPSNVYMFIGIAIALFITSGLVGVIIQDGGESEGPNAPRDVILIIAGIIIFIVVIMIASASMAGGEQK